MNEEKIKELENEVQRLHEELENPTNNRGLIQEYLSGLSHDIRTPLNAIVGFSSLLGEIEYENEELEYYSKMIIRSSKKLLDTIRNLIDLARIETGSMHLSTENVNIAELFEELKDDLHEELRLYGKQEIKTTIRPLYNGSGIIQTDKIRLYQVLKTFLDNSVKFTKQGEITLGSQILGDGSIAFRVSDTGSGMDTVTLESVFSMFTNQKTGQGKKIKSRGLGMMIAHQLTGMMEGKLDVQSSLSEGTVVSLVIPQLPDEK